MKNILLFFSIFLFIAPVIAEASQIAIVKGKDTIVYADDSLTSPIGKLEQGKKIKIGSKLRYYGKVATTVFQRRIVYLNSKDLFIKEIKKDQEEISEVSSESRFILNELELQSRIEKDSRKYFGVYLSQSAPMGEFDEVSQKLEADPNTVLLTVGVNTEFNINSGPMTIYMGGEFTSGGDENMHTTMSLIQVMFGYSILEIQDSSLDLLFGPVISPFIIIETEGGDYYSKGNGWGAEGQARVHMFKSKKWGIAAGLSYRWQRVHGMSEIQLPTEYRETTSLKELTEAKTHVTFNYNF